ncbi:hypothetical protein QYF36_005469 [Acer negundo]|nr:hypothetical protein QYF36_005469 [Acer negundo]
MKRQSNVSGRNEGYAVISRELNVLVELDANFPMMSKELQIQANRVLRTKSRNGDMKSLKVIKKVLDGVIRILVSDQQAMERP